jgi:MFS family permease
LKLWTANTISNLGDGIGTVAYPWLASAITRNAVLIALVGVAQRIPWLVFSLPAGVITDRVDRRRLIVVMDAVRAAITLVVAFSVLASDDLPAPGEVAGGAATGDMALYLVLLLATLLLGTAEVLRDNTAQTILPAIVPTDRLEVANGRMWGAEMIANSFVGPPLGSFLLGLLFAVPFFIDAGSFAVAAALVFFLTGEFRPEGRTTGRISWRAEISEGLRWLWGHALLRPLAVILGWMNGLSAMAFATLVLFAQEVLHLDPFLFAVLSTGAAVGGVLGSALGPRVSRRFGPGTAMYATIVIGGLANLVIGASSQWAVAWSMLLLMSGTGMVWNVITVSLRQTIIPDHLLGRVNSVYRFFGLGTMPLGLALGGALVWAGEMLGSRTLGLRLPFLVAGAAYLILFTYAAPRLTTAKVEAARAAAVR